MTAIRVGTCGFSTRQAEYFRRFDCIEIQKTFYRPPQVKTAERWRQAAGERFEFTLKAFQAVTHPPSSPTYRRSMLSDAQREKSGSFRDTKAVRDAWKTTLRIARALKATFVIFQCPARFGPSRQNLKNLKTFFEWAERDQLRFGWEPRGKQWTARLVRDLCRNLQLVHVVDPFVTRPRYGTPRYFRLHGIGRDGRSNYYYRYRDSDLRQLAEMCSRRGTYCLFNNVSMADDAGRFSELLGR